MHPGLAEYGALFDAEPEVMVRLRTAVEHGDASHSSPDRVLCDATRAALVDLFGVEDEAALDGKVAVHAVEDEETMLPTVPENWATYARRIAKTLRSIVRAADEDEDVVCVTHGYGVVVSAFALAHREVFDIDYCATLVFEEDEEKAAFHLVSGDDALLPWREGKVEHKPAPIRLRA